MEALAERHPDDEEATIFAAVARISRPLRDRDYHSFHWLMDAYLAMEDFERACGLIAEIDSLEKLARERGEELGRIPSVAEEVRSQYRDRAEEANPALTCDSLH